MIGTLVLFLTFVSNYKLAVITYRTRSIGNPAYRYHLIQDYLPACTLRSSYKLLLTAEWR